MSSDPLPEVCPVCNKKFSSTKPNDFSGGMYYQHKGEPTCIQTGDSYRKQTAVLKAKQP